jgi:hypothetical protein
MGDYNFPGRRAFIVLQNQRINSAGQIALFESQNPLSFNPDLFYFVDDLSQLVIDPD